MTRTGPTDKLEPVRPPTPTEQVRALPRPAHDTYHQVPKKQIAAAIALAGGTQPKLPPVLPVRVERKGDLLEVRVGDRTVSISREEARELGATLMHLAR